MQRSEKDRRHIAVMLPNWIGDVVMATPVLRAIKESFPTSKLTGIMRPYVRQVLEGTQWLDRQIMFDPRSHDVAQRGQGVIRQLRNDRPDTMLLLTNSLRAAMISYLGGARERVGFARNGRALLLTERLNAEKEDGRWKPVPTIDYYLDVARAAGIDSDSKQMELATVDRDEETAQRIQNVFSFDDARPLVILNSGGARGAAKSWPQEHFVALAKLLRREMDAAVLVLAGPAEMEVAGEIETSVNDCFVRSMANEKVRLMVDSSVSLGVAKALVKRASLMITTDSGPRHFAHAFGTPVVALYGANNPKWTVPYDDNSFHLWEQLDCSFCEQRNCPLGHHQCMKNLKVQRVFDAAKQLIIRQGASAA